MFRTGFLSIIRSLVLTAVSITCMTYMYLLLCIQYWMMMDRKPVRNI